MLMVMNSKKVGKNEKDTVAAFAAMGGNDDKTGSVKTAQLKEVIDSYELTVDIEMLIGMYDTDESGFLDYDEFSAMLADDAQN